MVGLIKKLNRLRLGGRTKRRTLGEKSWSQRTHQLDAEGTKDEYAVLIKVTPLGRGSIRNVLRCVPVRMCALYINICICVCVYACVHVCVVCTYMYVYVCSVYRYMVCVLHV